MAENPAAWSKATVVIADAMDEVYRQAREDAEHGDFRCGFTTPMVITLALKNAGYLTDEALMPREASG